MGEISKPFALGYWSDPKPFGDACEASFHAGHAGHRAFTPWAVHGLEKRMGIRRSWVGRPVLFMLLFGAFCGFMMQLWMMKYDWPLSIGGKPYNSWPAFVVITFESGILCGALTNLLVCLLVACKIIPTTRIVTPDPKLTDDTFCLAIPVSSTAELAEREEWLKQHGAERVDRYVPAEPAVAGEPAHA
jgi:hypothetical protein